MSTYRAFPARLLRTLVQAFFATRDNTLTCNTLIINMFKIQEQDYLTMAAKAVRSYVSRKFNGFFSENDLEDLTSEVAMRMWAGRASFDPEKGKEFTWVWTIAKNVVKDAATAKSNRANIGAAWSDDVEKAAERMVSDDRADGELLRDEFVEDLYGRLRQERDRRLLLYLAQDMEYEEIARHEGLTLRATYMAIFHLRQRLDKNTAA